MSTVVTGSFPFVVDVLDVQPKFQSRHTAPASTPSPISACCLTRTTSTVLLPTMVDGPQADLVQARSLMISHYMQVLSYTSRRPMSRFWLPSLLRPRRSFVLAFLFQLLPLFQAIVDSVCLVLGGGIHLYASYHLATTGKVLLAYGRHDEWGRSGVYELLGR